MKFVQFVLHHLIYLEVPIRGRVVLLLVGTLLVLTAGISVSAQQVPEIGPEKGEMYPDVRLPRLDGSNGKLSDYRGQKVILFHFASW